MGGKGRAAAWDAESGRGRWEVVRWWWWRWQMGEIFESNYWRRTESEAEPPPASMFASVCRLS
jgi:hypothetical protein